MKRYRDIIREPAWIFAPVPVSSPRITRIHHNVRPAPRAPDLDRPA
jgi:hypothetical protein